MSIAADTTTSSISTSGSGTLTGINLTVSGAAIGAVMLVVGSWSVNEASITFPAGWTQLASANVNTGHYGLWWKVRQSTDTTVGVSWPTLSAVSLVMASYTGVSQIQPVELFNTTTYTSSSTALATPTQTPGGPLRWGVGAFSSNAASTFTFTPSGGVSNRVNAVSTTTTPFTGAQIADSNGTVAVSSATYTSTVSQATTAGQATQLFLVPDGPVPDVFKFQAVNRASTY